MEAQADMEETDGEGPECHPDLGPNCLQGKGYQQTTKVDASKESFIITLNTNCSAS